MDNKSVILPKWIDKIIFDDFEAVYEPCPMEVVYNPDQPYEFVKLYLGTYFPRSFAEAYSIQVSQASCIASPPSGRRSPRRGRW